MGDKNFSNTTPSAVSGLNVTWQQDGSGNLSAYTSIFGPSGTGHAPGLVPDPGSTSGATHYLREDGNWEVPSTGSGAYPIGANIVALPPVPSGNSGNAGYSFILKVPGTAVVAFTSKFTVTFCILGNLTSYGSTYDSIINTAVIRRTAQQSTTWIDSTSITWPGGNHFTPSQTSAVPQFYQSNAITLAMDAAHDYYVILYMSTTMSNNAIQGSTTVGGSIGSTALAGYISGNQTATADASTFASLNGVLVGISQFQTA